MSDCETRQTRTPTTHAAPRTAPRTVRRHLIAAALLLATQAPQTALAQSAGPATSFSIPAQPLDLALNQFARQAGLQLLAPPALLQGLQGQAVQRQLSVSAGVALLLQGSGLVGRLEGSTLVIERAAAAVGGTLSAVTVVASAQESAMGPVQGYVARRSATGTKTDTPLLEVPQSISVIGREEMEARGVQNIMDAVRYTPGVTVNNWGFDPRGIDWILMRGFDTTAGISGYRDGLVMPAYSVSEPYGLERIEVLRGPASVVFGQGDAGGIINRVSKMPSNTPVREVELSYGTFQRKKRPSTSAESPATP